MDLERERKLRAQLQHKLLKTVQEAVFSSVDTRTANSAQVDASAEAPLTTHLSLSLSRAEKAGSNGENALLGAAVGRGWGGGAGAQAQAQAIVKETELLRSQLETQVCVYDLSGVCL